MKKTGTSILPIPVKDRNAGGFSLFWLWCGGNVLLVTFMVGSDYAPSIGLLPTIVLTIFANLAAYTCIAWSSQRSAKYGIDEIIALRPTYGIRGSIFGVIILVGINFGWVGILTALAGKSAKHVMITYAGGFTFTGDYVIYSLIGISIPIVFLLINPKYGFTLAKVTFPFFIALTIYILYKLIQPENWNAMASVKPTFEVGGAYVFELCVAFAVAWLPYLGAWNKFAKSQRHAYWTSYLGLTAMGILFGLVGGMATLLTGQYEPPAWAGQIDVGLPAYLIIVFGNITTIALLTYGGVMAVLSIFPNLKYQAVILALALPSTLFIFSTSLQDMFNYILLFVGLLAGPYWAVSIADFYFLRKEKIDVKECYNPAGIYKYFHGFNPVAIGAQVIGMIVWVYLGGWMSGMKAFSYTSGEGLFHLLSATFPSMVIAGLVYVIAGKIVFSKYRQGGYTFSKQNNKQTDRAAG